MEVLFIWLAIAFLTGLAANVRGRNGFVWLFLGLLFSVFASIAVFILPNLNKAKAAAAAETAAAAAAAAMKRCPACAEQIQLAAKKCRFCGETMPTPRTGTAWKDDITSNQGKLRGGARDAHE